MNNDFSMNLKDRSINWGPPTESEEVVTLKGTFTVDDKTYEVTVKCNKKDFSKEIGKTLENQIGEIGTDQLSKFDGYRLEGNLKDLKEHGFDVFRGNEKISDLSHLNSTISSISNIFSKVFDKQEKPLTIEFEKVEAAPPKVEVPTSKYEWRKKPTEHEKQIRKALRLHEEHGFKSTYSRPHLAQFNKNTGIVQCTPTQFKKALLILNKEFPKLADTTPEQKIVRTQLLQTILSGNHSITPSPSITLKISEDKQTLALDLNKTLGFQENIPKVDPKTGLTLCSAEQFIQAKEMLKENFPETANYNTAEENILGAQLLQIILTGKHTELKDDKCFVLKELDGKLVPDEVYDTKGKTFLLNNLQFFTRKDKNKELTEQELLSDGLDEMVNAFQKDCFQRPLNYFQLKEQAAPIGGPGNENPLFIQELNASYTKYLIENPREIGPILNKIEQSDLHGALRKNQKELSLPYDNLDEKSIFPESVLLKIVKNTFSRFLPPNPTEDPIINAFRNYALENIIVDQEKEVIENITQLGFEKRLVEETLKKMKWGEENQNHFLNLQRTIMYSRIDPSTIKEISEKANIPENKIEALARIKTLEVIILFSQASSGTTSQFNVPLLFQGEVPLMPQPKQIIFSFSEDFQLFNTTSYWEMMAPMDEALQIAKADSKAMCPLYDLQTPVTVSPVENVVFSWKAEAKHINRLKEIASQKQFL